MPSLLLLLSLSTEAIGQDMMIQPARTPVIHELDLLGPHSPTVPTVPPGAVDLISKLAEENQGRLITISIKGAPLRFADLPNQVQSKLLNNSEVDVVRAYETRLADQLEQMIGVVLQKQPGIAISIEGLPFEDANADKAMLAESNHRYQGVIDGMTAFVSSKTLVIEKDGLNAESGNVRRAFKENLRLSEGRPLIYRVNGNWRISIPTKVKPATPKATGQASKSSGNSKATRQRKVFNTPRGSYRNKQTPSTSSPKKKAAAPKPAAPSGSTASNTQEPSGSTPADEPAPVAAQQQAGDEGDEVVVASGWTPLAEIDLSETGPSFSPTPTVIANEPVSIVTSGAAGVVAEGPVTSSGNTSSPVVPEQGTTMAATGSQLYLIVLANWGNEGGEGDLNQSGLVDGADLAIALAHDSQNGGGSGPGTGETLVAGSGFSGETSQPGPVGNPSIPGYSNKPMARWDVVPFQTTSLEFPVGVVAYHINGIAKVDISLDGGPWLAIDQPSLNPRTLQEEYWAYLPGSQLSDGVHELRAIIWPVTGTPRVLAGAIDDDSAYVGEHSMFVSSNAGGSLPTLSRWVAESGSDQTGDGSKENPYSSIMKAARSIQDEQGQNADGGMIYLMPGDYMIGDYSWSLHTNIENRWLTITHDPQTPQSAVSINGVTALSGIRTKLLRFHRLNIQMPSDGSIGQYIFSSAPGQFKWVSESHLNGPGRLADGDWGSGGVANYVTDTAIENCQRPFMANIYRNVDLRHIGVDAMRGQVCKLVLDVMVEDLNGCGSDSGAHNDLLQFHSSPGAPPISNCIYRDMNSPTGDQCSGQGIFSGDAVTVEDLAFVNCFVTNQSGEEYVARVMQFGGSTTHMLLDGCTLIGPANWRTDQNFVGQAIRIVDTWFDSANTEFFVLYPDKPAAWDPPNPGAHWPGTLPWTSPVTNVTYTDN
ncbi:MAG: hypothetical protein CMJ32_11000 [Phycisphaerae bacterium]|nr:hypothetical protein [Phycisphaerae bacterium]